MSSDEYREAHDEARQTPAHDCIADDNVGCAACEAEGADERISWTLGGIY